MATDLIGAYDPATDVIDAHDPATEVIGAYDTAPDAIGVYDTAPDVIGAYDTAPDVAVEGMDADETVVDWTTNVIGADKTAPDAAKDVFGIGDTELLAAAGAFGAFGAFGANEAARDVIKDVIRADVTALPLTISAFEEDNSVLVTTAVVTVVDDTAENGVRVEFCADVAVVDAATVRIDLEDIPLVVCTCEGEYILDES